MDLLSLFSWCSSWSILAYFSFLFSLTLVVVKNFLECKLYKAKTIVELFS